MNMRTIHTFCITASQPTREMPNQATGQQIYAERDEEAPKFLLEFKSVIPFATLLG
jgi:hypothetical protein